MYRGYILKIHNTLFENSMISASGCSYFLNRKNTKTSKLVIFVQYRYRRESRKENSFSDKMTAKKKTNKEFNEEVDNLTLRVEGLENLIREMSSKIKIMESFIEKTDLKKRSLRYLKQR